MKEANLIEIQPLNYVVKILQAGPKINWIKFETLTRSFLRNS